MKPMTENNTEETPEVSRRRSALKRELDAFGELVRVLKPFSKEQRARMLATAASWLETSEDS